MFLMSDPTPAGTGTGIAPANFRFINREAKGDGGRMALTQPTTRTEAVTRQKRLTGTTIGWNVVEGVVAVAAGIAAGSVSLIGFGLDSGIEVSAAVVLAWRLAQERRTGCKQDADKRAPAPDRDELRRADPLRGRRVDTRPGNGRPARRVTGRDRAGRPVAGGHAVPGPGQAQAGSADGIAGR